MFRIAFNQTKYGDMMYLHNDVAFSSELEKGKIYEQEMIEEHLKEIVQKSDIILDIGAHCGSHTVIYSKLNPNAKIYAFEPQKKLFKLLTLNIKINDILNATLLNCAIGNKICDASMSQVCIDGPTQFKPLNDEDLFNFGGLQVGIGGDPTKMLTIDFLFDHFKINLGENKRMFMKIDVEGFEPFVLDGAMETIIKYKPTIFFESTNKVPNPTMIEFFTMINYSPYAKLNELGYTITPILNIEDGKKYLSGSYVAAHTL